VGVVHHRGSDGDGGLAKEPWHRRLLQQRHHLAPERVVFTGLRRKRSTLLRRAFERCVIEPLEHEPTVCRHGERGRSFYVQADG
jgi:hypothetical protein